MGLEPTTFCMANARDRSHAFASVRSNPLFAATSGRASERQRTRPNAECSHCSHCVSCHIQSLTDGRVSPEGVRNPPPQGSAGHDPLSRVTSLAWMS
jgi:hypothetical protein